MGLHLGNRLEPTQTILSGLKGCPGRRNRVESKYRSGMLHFPVLLMVRNLHLAPPKDAIA